MFSVSFVVMFDDVVVFGYQESVGKLKKKNKVFIFIFFTMKPSRLKIQALFVCQENLNKIKELKILLRENLLCSLC